MATRGVTPSEMFIMGKKFLVLSSRIMDGDNIVRAHEVYGKELTRDLVEAYEHIGGKAIGMPVTDAIEILGAAGGPTILKSKNWDNE